MATNRSLLSFDTGVWDRAGADVMGRRAFLGVISGLTLWGLGVNAGLAYWALQTGFQPSFWVGIGMMALPFAGVLVSNFTKSLAGGLLGYHLILVPFGLMLGPILSAYTKAGAGAIVSQALILTGCTTGIMTLLGLTYPNLFSRLGGVLFGGLIALLLLRLVGMFVPSIGHAGWIDWLAAGIFTLYIGYDWYRAMTLPATARNAVDVAISLYLDIINLFLTILRLLGRRD
ncbi:MAG: Bax inhibitor-1/YccA family protein [Holophaga sp.]|nr:Bax inhibitor-1/YccA family protein [Holophaga sp.]